MVKPNTSDFISDALKSRKFILSKELARKVARLMCSLALILIYEPIMATNEVKSISIGTIKRQAVTLVKTDIYRAWRLKHPLLLSATVTFIAPSSAPMLEPTFPAHISAVTNGASALKTAMPMREGNHEVAPKSLKDGLDCFVNTTPMIKPVRDIRGRESQPIL
jgi:hypothetical protein